MPWISAAERVRRILSRIEQPDGPDGCWLFMGARNSNGYGLTWQNGTAVGTHRFLYQHFKGPIPTGLHLDHLCRVRHCVNPDHLEPVTPAENVRRGAGSGGSLNPNREAIDARRLLAEQRRAEQRQRFAIPLESAPEGSDLCRNGHPLIPQNVKVRTEGGRRVRRCLTCYRAKKAAEKRKMRRARSDARKAMAA